MVDGTNRGSGQGSETELTLLSRDELEERVRTRTQEIENVLDTIGPSYSVDPFERLIDACLTMGDRAAAREWCDRTLKHFEESESQVPERLRSFLTERRADLQSSARAS